MLELEDHLAGWLLTWKLDSYDLPAPENRTQDEKEPFETEPTGNVTETSCQFENLLVTHDSNTCQNLCVHRWALFYACCAAPIQAYRNTKIRRTEPTRRIAGAIGAGYRA